MWSSFPLNKCFISVTGDALDDEQRRKLSPELFRLLRLLWKPFSCLSFLDNWDWHLWSLWWTSTGWRSFIRQHYKPLVTRRGRRQLAQLRSPPHSDHTLALLMLVFVAQMDQKKILLRMADCPPTKTGAKEQQSFRSIFLMVSLLLLLQTRMQSKMDFDYRENFNCSKDDISFQYFSTRVWSRHILADVWCQ